MKPSEMFEGENSALRKEYDSAVGYPTFYSTVVTSPQWETWVKQNEEHPEYDVHESIETGWLSQKHFQAFLEFCKTI